MGIGLLIWIFGTLLLAPILLPYSLLVNFLTWIFG